MVQAHPGWDLLTSPPLSPHPVIASQAKQSLSIVILASTSPPCVPPLLAGEGE
jgi:hypothetical protein